VTQKNLLFFKRFQEEILQKVSFIDILIPLSYIKIDVVLGLKGMPEKNEQEIKLTWELACRQCKASFEVPVPRGPTEEKELKCPICGSESIERIEASNPSPPPCGG
jgi:hypothetical protein